MKKVLYLAHATPQVYSIIRDAVPDGFELVTLEQDDDDERRRKIAGCEVVIVAATPLRKPMIEAAKRLELVHHQGVGWQDTIDHEVLRARGIPLALTPEGTTVGVAEHTVLLMLAALKLLPYADSELRQGRFHVNALRPISRELTGMTVGYIGMGRIATAVSERLRAFGTRGIFFDPNVSTCGRAASPDLRSGSAGSGRGHAARSADAANAPHDRCRAAGANEARRLSRQCLARRSRGRSGTRDALKAGHLAAAALDVFETEPLPAGHPLSRLENVVLTPHIAAGTRDALTTKMRALFANVARFYRGEPLNNRVF